MRELQELEILILELIYKHPSINNTYTLTRFFAKSSILPDKLYATLKDLVARDYITINETINTINRYKITLRGKAVLNEIDVFDYTEGFAWEIDTTGFIAKIVFHLENKENLVEIADSFLLSDSRMIAFIQADDGKLTDTTILENFHQKKWRIKQYLQVCGSIETYETIKLQEEQNTFQYLIEGIEHSEKPEKGEMLRVLKTSANTSFVK